MWLDNNCQIFVGNSEPDTAEYPLYCVMWCQVAEHRDNLEPDMVDTVLKMPVIIEA